MVRDTLGGVVPFDLHIMMGIRYDIKHLLMTILSLPGRSRSLRHSSRDAHPRRRVRDHDHGIPNSSGNPAIIRIGSLNAVHLVEFTIGSFSMSSFHYNEYQCGQYTAQGGRH